LADRMWDAALDTCAYVPRAVAEVGHTLGHRLGFYAFVSTLSVLEGDIPEGADEDTPIHAPPYPDTEEITGETYGPLKAASEVEAARAFAGRCLIVRPGYIVGPHDPTERFVYYVRRAAAGGQMLAPGPPDAPFQVVDVRDLADFMLSRIEAGDTDTYGLVGPDRPITMRDVLEVARAVAGAGTELTWVDEAFLRRLDDDVETLLPMWHPDSPGAHTYDAGRAVRAGLRRRGFEETVRDTLAWDRRRGTPPLPGRVSAQREGELLRAWREESGQSASGTDDGNQT
ncbi:MAG TPA: epimerase, partial [Actinomycetota bacterium]|nr:epimerase [Actinomycetota bacterium]